MKTVTLECHGFATAGETDAVMESGVGSGRAERPGWHGQVVGLFSQADLGKFLRAIHTAGFRDYIVN
mgnify:CR=1 FL=1